MSSAIERFDQLDLPAPLLKALEAVGYETPSPIQAACIPHLLAGRDLLGEAQTGTGKTAAFALPLLARIDTADRRPQALVLTPTRELAIQVAEAFQRYASQLPNFHVLPLYGGQSMVVQLRQLNRGAQVVVGTPGRIKDHLERKSLVLDSLRGVVLDEADEMLRMGFIDDVEWILEHTPASRQTALFSATMPAPIRRVAHKYLREPQEVKIKAATSTVAAIRQRYWAVAGMSKLDGLTRILEVEEDLDAAIIFVRTKTSTVELAEKLEARGYAAAALNGDMQQPLRERVIEQLKGGALDIVVATDVAARGLDVPRISHVFNYDIPYDTEAYVHRIGRTGRAGRAGNAILFAAPRERRMLKMIEQATRQPIEAMQLPSKEMVASRRVNQFKQQVVEVIETQPLEFFENIVRQLMQEQNTGAREIAAALAWLAQAERPLQIDGAAEPVREVREAPPGRPERKTLTRSDARTAEPAEARPVASPEPDAAEAPAPRARQKRDTVTALSSVLKRYRLDAGREHGVTPKDIVGAIANEAGIESRHIGQIDLFDDYCTVELPENLPEDTLQVLKRARLRGRPMDLALYTGSVAPKRSAARPAGEKKPYGDKKPYGEKNAFGERKPYGEKKPYGDKKSFGDKPFGEKKAYGSKSGSKPFADRKAAAGKAGADKRPFAKKVFDGKSTKKRG